MIDMHSHLIFGVDDGSKSYEESITIISSLAKFGYTDLILTPHYVNNSSYTSNKNNNLHILRELQEGCKLNNIDINLYLGNEIYIDNNIEELLLNQEVSSLNNTKYLLVELPMSGEYEERLDILIDLINKGYIIILAHPERYYEFQKNFDIVYELKEKGIKFQCNIGSILGMYGKSAKNVVKRMLKEKLVFCIGTDIHHNNMSVQFLNKAKKQINKYVKDDYLNQLFNSNISEVID